MEDSGDRVNEQDSRATALNACDDQDDTLAFIMQVKEKVERCLEAGMSKEQMFRELREKGSHPATTFAVYKELRRQNIDFFKEYYVKKDLTKQAKRLKLLLHQYRAVRTGDADTRPPGTATQQTGTAVLDDVGLLENGSVLVGLDGNSQSATASAQLPSPLMHVPTGQMLHPRESQFNDSVEGGNSVIGSLY